MEKAVEREKRTRKRARTRTERRRGAGKGRGDGGQREKGVRGHAAGALCRQQSGGALAGVRRSRDGQRDGVALADVRRARGRAEASQCGAADCTFSRPPPDARHAPALDAGAASGVHVVKRPPLRPSSPLPPSPPPFLLPSRRTDTPVAPPRFPLLLVVPPLHLRLLRHPSTSASSAALPSSSPRSCPGRWEPPAGTRRGARSREMRAVSRTRAAAPRRRAGPPETPRTDPIRGEPRDRGGRGARGPATLRVSRMRPRAGLRTATTAALSPTPSPPADPPLGCLRLPSRRPDALRSGQRAALARTSLSLSFWMMKMYSQPSFSLAPKRAKYSRLRMYSGSVLEKM